MRKVVESRSLREVRQLRVFNKTPEGRFDMVSELIEPSRCIEDFQRQESGRLDLLVDSGTYQPQDLIRDVAALLTR